MFLADSYVFSPTAKISLYRASSLETSFPRMFGLTLPIAVAAFVQSKLAMVTFTNELAFRLEGIQVVANAVHPGPVATGAQLHIAPIGMLLSVHTRVNASMQIRSSSKHGAQSPSQ